MVSAEQYECIHYLCACHWYPPCSTGNLGVVCITTFFNFHHYNFHNLSTHHHTCMVLTFKTRAQFSICYSSATLSSEGQVCCTNSSVSFKYATFTATPDESSCVTLEWNCGQCTGNTGRTCQTQITGECDLMQTDVSCTVCATNSNFVWTRQIGVGAEGF